MKKPWWLSDEYNDDTPIPDALIAAAGPHGVAAVRVWEDGRTSRGWGLRGPEGEPGFMENYTQDKFRTRPVLHGYTQGRHAFALVMRSLSAIAVDIDGKNGGLEHAHLLLGNSPPTTAEVSKSGTGYHIFYDAQELWDPVTGFGAFSDLNGIVQGVDIRAVGCVYHHPQQRWNGRPLAPLPQWIAEPLLQKRERREAQTNTITRTLATGDMEEILMLHDTLLDELAQSIPAGRRNNTLFAIGCKLRTAELEDWEERILNRADEVGLDSEEAEHLVRSIARQPV